jgi:hypothetical protein
VGDVDVSKPDEVLGDFDVRVEMQSGGWLRSIHLIVVFSVGPHI